MLLNGAYRGNPAFAVALLSLDRDGSTADGRSIANVLPLLPKLASVIRTCMRDSDFVARYGDDEFVVVMPQTSSPGPGCSPTGCGSEWPRNCRPSVCCGLTEVQPDDDARALLGPCRFGPVQREGGRCRIGCSSTRAATSAKTWTARSRPAAVADRDNAATPISERRRPPILGTIAAPLDNLPVEVGRLIRLISPKSLAAWSQGR